MELMNQPFTGQLGDRLIELLDSSDYHTLNIVVAFAKNSGVNRLKDSFENFRKRGGIVNVYVGIDMGVTSYDALTALLLNTDSLNVVHSQNQNQTFHPKIYQFLGKEKGLMVVGSHNLTGGGLWTNFESSMFIPLNEMGNNTLVKGAEIYIGQLTSLKDSFMSIGAQEDIDKLLQNGYVLTEAKSQEKRKEESRLKAATQKKNSERLFGNGVPAKLPPLTMTKNKRALAVSATSESPVSKPLSGEYQTIWFETRKLTGGSRNILDLSMKSLLDIGDPTGASFDLGEPKFMAGGVVFFGIDPEDKDKRKNITLKFKGFDYVASEIFYAPNNGSWRIQIHGENSSNTKITEIFKDLNTKEGERYDDKGKLLHYLQLKIITFTKIRDDYYSMSVFPESKVEEFKAESRIVARNGASKTSKWFGLL